MSLFSKRNEHQVCGAIIDIGSGSIGVAVIIVDTEQHTLHTVWSHREFMLIKDVSDQRELLREINTTLINALLELGSNGLKALASHTVRCTLDYVQATFSAPWAHTVSKTIRYDSDVALEVTAEFIEDLVTAVESKKTDKKSDADALNTLGLQIIGQEVLQITLNDYIVTQPIGKKAKQVSLSVITAAVQQKILQTLEQSCEKILPKATVEYYAFIDMFYRTLRHMRPSTSEICLVNITNEATEIGIVRDDVLRYATHNTFGLYGIARLLAKTCSIPNEEAFSLLRTSNTTTIQTYPQKVQENIQTIFKLYEGALTKLFLETGDALSIPKTIFIHTSTNTEAFFNTLVKDAAAAATKDEHSVHLVTKELFSDLLIDDSALALSAHFFQTIHTP